MTSLIIITLRRAALLKQTLLGLSRQSRPIDEIIVIDNGPTSETEETVQSLRAKLPVRYVPEPRRGYGYARNRGLSEATGEVIYFLDDDCVPDPDWSDLLWNILSLGIADLAGGSRSLGQSGLAARLEYLSTDGPIMSPSLAAGPTRHLSTSNLILRREVIAKIGCFDTSLTMCEDRDFTTRARKAGFRLHFEPKARVTHYPGIHALSDYLRKMHHYGKGTTEYFRRWRDDEPLARLFPANPSVRLLSVPALAAAGTAYLVLRNFPQCLDALPLSPLLLVGQVWWQWGGFEAVRSVDRPVIS